MDTAAMFSSGPQEAGKYMHALMRKLYPICRSITGSGIRQTFDIIGQDIPLTVTSIPSDTPAFDWTIPREWNVREAYIKGPDGSTVVDFKNNSLHIVGYSTPVKTRLPLRELREHLYSLPDQPDLIPFRASYYRESWGFCLSHNQLAGLAEGEYEVVIDSSLEPGNLDYAECVIAGASEQEILVSAHSCHPSLCNDNLSGVVLSTCLARELLGSKPKYTYRFLFIPTIIGSIAWLSQNQGNVGRIAHGLVLTCVGDDGRFNYKRTRAGDREVDRAVEHVLRVSQRDFSTRDFVPYGYDERNYCSPGFDLPVGTFSRSVHGTFPQYHTSADNLDFVRAEYLGESFQICSRILEVLEHNGYYMNQNPHCEPQLGRRGLYNVIGGLQDGQQDEMAMFWLLNQSDGRNSLLDIAARADIPFATIHRVAGTLEEHHLLVPCTGEV